MQSIYCLFGKLCLYKAFPKECFSFTLHFKCLRACIMNIKCRNKCCECSQKSAGQPKKNCYIFSFATSLSACSADKSLLVEPARTCPCACMCECKHAHTQWHRHSPPHRCLSAVLTRLWYPTCPSKHCNNKTTLSIIFNMIYASGIIFKII